MKQVLQDRSGTTVVRDVPQPACPPGSMLVRNAFSVISSGTERSRVELSQKSLLGKARERPDLVREVINRARREGIGATRAAVKQKLSPRRRPSATAPAGVVIEVGEAVTGFGPGDRVACAGGGHASHAEIVSVPGQPVREVVPPEVGLDVAAMTTIAAIALHGIRLADVRVGERVGVVGCGLVGQIACRLLQASGAQVFALDVDAQRVEQAVAHGAAHGVVVDADAAARVDAATGGRRHGRGRDHRRRADERPARARRRDRPRPRARRRSSGTCRSRRRGRRSTTRSSRSASPARTGRGATTSSTRSAVSTTRSATCAGRSSGTWRRSSTSSAAARSTCAT